MNTSLDDLDGTLISPRAAGIWLAAQPDIDAALPAAVADWASSTLATLGPSASQRRLQEALDELFEGVFGCACRREPDGSVAAAGSSSVVLIARPWGHALALTQREPLSAALAERAQWIAGFNGAAMGWADARPDAPRRCSSITLDAMCSRPRAARLVAALFSRQALDACALAALIGASDAASAEVRIALRSGVERSLASLSRALPFDAGLAVVFRMLFVLFAEARSLVPVWNQVYRDHYSLASLARDSPPAHPRGTWAALEARRRLLGRGCRAGTLHVHGFNGRLFAPGPARRWARSARLESHLDLPAAEALASLVAYRPARGGARRVNYAELDVEELGAIYERVLDLDPDGAGRLRKESGSFYTPRPLTELLVRRTLAPLAAGASSARILALRVLDPAMGSGAFLVAALRYLSSALETALVREGALPEHDVTERDRQALRRQVARSCLYGVDVNPTAATLAKLSLWLATLSGDKPLGFLDHRLKCGNSLTGITPAIAARPPGTRDRHAPLPLFDAAEIMRVLDDGGVASEVVGSLPEETVADVRRKQREFDAAGGSHPLLSGWKMLCDIWCASWFDRGAAPDAREYRAIADALVRGARTIPHRTLNRRQRHAAAIAARERFFHWPLEFAEVFGSVSGSPGFDAIVGNPPWEMLRAGSGSDARPGVNRFVREAGMYPLSSSGHVNLYQVFLERTLSLLRDGGRFGIVAPWGLMTDEGSARLRARLLDACRVDTLVRLDNGEGIFDAHRSLRFAALTGATAGETHLLELSRASPAGVLTEFPDSGAPGRGAVLTREAISVVGGPSRRIPDARDASDMSWLYRIASAHRGLGDPAGWGAVFSRELNLTDDKRAFSPSGLPVLEGKHVHPHRVDAAGARYFISAAKASRLLPHRPFDRPRLAYRDVTAATNHQTLIAAIVPGGVLTSHSLFCLQNPWDLPAQTALCIVLNSRIANQLMRYFVSAHITTALMAWLPVPERSRVVAALRGIAPQSAEAEAIVAELYDVV